MAAPRKTLPIADRAWDDRGDFDATLAASGMSPLRRAAVTTLQVNVGKRCNQACHHCHVEAGPKRTESMSAEVAARILDLLAASPEIHTLDITGGAPELNPNFRALVAGARRLQRAVIDRCNLTILFERGQEDLAEFLAEHQVQVTASLPCYSPANVDTQRGKGVFGKSLAALEKLNALGYGKAGSNLMLDLVYNPLGASLPPPQDRLEASYKRELFEHFGIEFNRLLTISNVPIARFAHSLERDGKYDEYMSLLVNHFNPANVPELMCRHLVSVSYDGKLYDCDFNQMLELELGGDARPPSVGELDSFAGFEGRTIATGHHCFACTAGAGSSCGGALGAS